MERQERERERNQATVLVTYKAAAAGCKLQPSHARRGLAYRAVIGDRRVGTQAINNIGPTDPWYNSIIIVPLFSNCLPHFAARERSPLWAV